MLITAYLSSREYQRFKTKAEQLGITEYALAKQGILNVIDQPIDTVATTVLLKKLMKAVVKDLDETKLF
jgi:hypothetical protein